MATASEAVRRVIRQAALAVDETQRLGERFVIDGQQLDEGLAGLLREDSGLGVGR